MFASCTKSPLIYTRSEIDNPSFLGLNISPPPFVSGRVVRGEEKYGLDKNPKLSETICLTFSRRQ